MEKTKRKTYDLTSGPILQRLLLVAVPIMGTQLMQMMYNLADMFWLGQLSSEAVAASGTGGMYLWLGQAFMMIGRMGSEIGVAQSLGKGDKNAAREYAQNSLLLSVGLGAVFGLLLVFARTPLVAVFNIQDPAVAYDAAVYLGLVGLGILPTYIASSIGGAYVGSGNSRTPFVINSVGLVVNIVLDPVLILWAGWGIAGAAIATTGAQTLMALIFVVAIKRGKGRPFDDFTFRVRASKQRVRQIFRWSTPIAVETMLFMALSTVISRYTNSFGTAAMAVQRVAGQVESLSWLIGGGFASAVTSFVGQNYGAEKWGRIRRGVKVSFGAMTVYGVAISFIMFFFGRFFCALFLKEAMLLDMGAEYLRILAVCQLVACLEYTSTGVFRGVGRTLPPTIVTTAGNLLRIPIIFWLGGQHGLLGIWWGIVIGAIIRSVAMVAWYAAMQSHLPKYDKGGEAQPQGV